MLKRAVSDAFRWSVKWYLGSFSSAIATFFFFNKYLDFEIWRSLRYGLGIFLLTLFFRVIIFYLEAIDNLEKQLTNRDEAKNKNRKIQGFHFYGEAILVLKDVFAKIHFIRKAPSLNKSELMKTLIFLCDKTKKIFEKRYPSFAYSVSIKIFKTTSADTELVEVITLCRDGDSHDKRSKKKPHTHNIKENTCFMEIFHHIDDPEKSHFISNSLPLERTYRNSSFQIWGTIPDTITLEEERRKHWTLPYKSEIVVPVSPLTPLATEPKRQFIGYLCVDCDHENAFHDKYDVGMLKGVADGMFDLIQKYHQN